MGLQVCHNFVGHTKQSTSAGSPSTLHVCCPPLGHRGRTVGQAFARATAIVTVSMADFRPWAIWWRGVAHPPPAPWSYLFELFTAEESADEWAMAAAIFVAQYRRRHSQGPTFRELFEHLLPDSNGFPSHLPREWDIMERRRGISGFRRHVTIEWRRRGYIGFDREVTRSLRVGSRFRERSRALHGDGQIGSTTALASDARHEFAKSARSHWAATLPQDLTQPASFPSALPATPSENAMSKKALSPAEVAQALALIEKAHQLEG